MQSTVALYNMILLDGLLSTHAHIAVSERGLGGLTLCVELRGIFGESFELHLLPQQLQEGGEGGRRLLVVVHFLLRALARAAQQNTHLVLLTQLRGSREITLIIIMMTVTQTARSQQTRCATGLNKFIYIGGKVRGEEFLNFSRGI